MQRWAQRTVTVTAAALAVAALCITAAPAAVATGDSGGATVVLDPGHGGSNGANDASLTRQVPNGRGGTKDCQTTGTATDDGYPEHSFNWDVVQRVRAGLEQAGVHTVLTRGDDVSAGPCVDQRAAVANAVAPAAIVSIHADGGPVSGSGFHVNYSSPALNDAQSGPALRLATTMRDALIASGLTPAGYIGSDGLYGRADLAGLNLARYPAVLVELGNMRNSGEATRMESDSGRAEYAAAIVSGVADYLRSTSTTG
jgi:N-acetylmuramoyl-L-alanine amidase